MESSITVENVDITCPYSGESKSDLQLTHWTWVLIKNPLSALTVESNSSVFYRYGGLGVVPSTFFAQITAHLGNFFAFLAFSFYSYVGSHSDCYVQRNRFSSNTNCRKRDILVRTLGIESDLQLTHWTWVLKKNPLSALTVESNSVFYRYGGLGVVPSTFFLRDHSPTCL